MFNCALLKRCRHSNTGWCWRVEGQGGSRGKSSAWIIIVVVAVVAVGIIGSIWAASFFLFSENIFGPPSHFTAQKNVTALTGQTSLEVEAGNSNINVLSGSGDQIMVNLTVFASVSLTSSNVYITVDSFGTTMKIGLHTPSSSVYLSTIGTVFVPSSLNLAYLNVSSSNGNLETAGVHAGNFNFSTLNGNVNLHEAGYTSTFAKSSNGNVYVTAAQNISGGSITMKTSNGNLFLSIGKSSGAYINLSTVNGGISTTNLNILSTTSTAHSLIGTINGGGATVIMQTSNGNITLTGI